MAFNLFNTKRKKTYHVLKVPLMDVYFVVLNDLHDLRVNDHTLSHFLLNVIIGGLLGAFLLFLNIQWSIALFASFFLTYLRGFIAEVIDGFRAGSTSEGDRIVSGFSLQVICIWDPGGSSAGVIMAIGYFAILREFLGIF